MRCLEKFITYMFNTCKNEIIIYAHNLTFDGSLLISNLPNDVKIVSSQTLIIKGDIYSLKLEKNNISIIFKCSYKILPMPLADIAKKINMKKLDINHNMINESNYMDNTIMTNVIEYCKKDVEITQSFLTNIYISLLNSGISWRYYTNSISGISINIFKTCFKNNNVVLSVEKNIDLAIRPSYYGGRCEVFGNPFDNDFIFHYDFTGMYTNRLKEKYPCGNPSFIISINKIDKPGFYSVTVNSKNFDIPILPYRSEKLLFPNGIFSGVYWYEELKLFEKNGGIIEKINWAYIYDKEEKLFEDFADYCKNMRVRDKLSNVLWKMIPNSFIGRMGIKPEYEKTIIIDENDYDPRNMNVISDKKINNKYIVRIKTCNIKKKINSNVTYAAITTSKARIIWWEAAMTVIKNGGRLLYCDTDSLFVSYKRDVSDEKHGDVFWDSNKEDTVIKDACFATSKAYSLKMNDDGNKTKIKGVPKDSMSFDDFKKTFYSSENAEIQTSQFKKSNLEIKIIDVSKNITMSGYDKRVFSLDKKTTEPLMIKR